MATGSVEFKVKITDDGSFKKLEIDAEGFNSAVKRIAFIPLNPRSSKTTRKGIHGWYYKPGVSKHIEF